MGDLYFGLWKGFVSLRLNDRLKLSTFSTALQYAHCIQTGNPFTATAYEWQGQGQTVGQAGSHIQMIRLLGH